MIEKTFPAADDSLADAIGMVEETMEGWDCSMKLVMQTTVCVEEMFVNVAHYAYGEGTGDVTLQIDLNDGIMSITLIDSGRPFDPLGKEDPDITLSAEERDIGGLGIYMVKKSMDSVAYRRENDKNIFTMTKAI